MRCILPCRSFHTVSLSTYRYGSVLVQLSSVAFRYGRRDPWILREVTLTVPRGRVVEVTGHNGAGKSTLLRLIAGIVRPRKGAITGRPTRVGFAPERFPTAQPFPVAAYLRHLAAMRRMADADAAIEEWSQRLRFGHLLDVPLSQLSKGSAHKVGLAQAMLADPELLVLDEPFAGLDADTRDVLPSLLAELADAGTTVVVSDHQRCLHDLPGVDRLRVEGHTVALDTGGRSELAVIEVVVAADEAEAVVRRLRADGLTVRGVRR
jgi:ABC-type multidrug transport system ATPase subunit